MEPSGAGELRDRVRFDRRRSADDGYGNSEGAWAPLVTARAAKLTPTRGGAEIIANRLQGVAAFDLWVRYDAATAAVMPGDRAVDVRNQNRVFAVRFGQDMTGHRRWILFQLEAGRADG